MNKSYDYIIVGGGPTGMTLAWILSKTKKKILIIDKNSNLGGSYNIQSYHRPQLYSDSYLSFIDILKDMGLDFYELFKKSTFKPFDDSPLTFSEKKILFYHMLFILFKNDYGKKLSLKNFLLDNNFSKKTYDYIQQVVELLFSISLENISLNQFLNFFNENYYYSLYHPKNEFNHFIKKWEEKLKTKENIEVILDTEVIKLNYFNNKIISIDVKNKDNIYKINADKVILTISGKHFVDLLSDTPQIKDSFGKLESINDLFENNKTLNNISLTFVYDKNVNLDNIKKNINSEWNINHTFNEINNNVHVFFIINHLNVKNIYNKTVNEMNYQDIVAYLLEITDLPQPKEVIISDKIQRMNNQWINTERTYALNMTEEYIGPNNNQVKNLFYIGNHNGNSLYQITSIESSIQNAITFCLYEVKDLHFYIKKKYTRKVIFIITDVIIIATFLLLLYLLKKYKLDQKN